MDNYYDHERGDWVTAESRYAEIATEARQEAIDAALIHEPRRAWALILELLAEIPEDTITFLGAGPIEDFVRAYAPEYIEVIEAEAATNSRFREALLEIWLPRDELPVDIQERIAVAAGPEFRFFRE